MTETGPSEDRDGSLRDEDIEAARQGGAAGARTVTQRGDVIGMAAERAVDALVSKVMEGKKVGNVRAWARIVGMNFARRMIARPRTVPLEDFTTQGGRGADLLDEPGFVERIVVLLEEHSAALTARQREVIRVLDPRLSIRANAKRVRMTPFSLRRMLRTVGRRALRPRC